MNGAFMTVAATKTSTEILFPEDLPWVRRQFYSFYWWMEKIIDPGTKSSQYTYRDILTSIIQGDSIWLDLGCGRSILPGWIRDQDALVRRAKSVAGVDYDWPSLTKHRHITGLVSGDAACLPFRDGAFNRISANMVVEHMADPVRSLQEIYRVLEPGGLFIYHTPNRRFYATLLARLIPESIKTRLVSFLEHRSESDIFPTLYRMNRLSAIHDVASKCSFRVLRCESLNTSAVSSIFLGPFAVVELLIRRILRHERLKEFRSNIIVVLEKV
jgi:ubiquinone/menaquinone biosynthesis C-methylase UbiE